MADKTILIKHRIKRLVFIAVYLLIGFPVFSFADEGKILFNSFEEDVPWIYSVNPDGTDLKKIIKNGLYPVWSPDRKMFAYLSSEDKVKSPMRGKFIVSIFDSNGKNEPVKTEITGTGRRLPIYYDWSPDGKHLAIVSFTSASKHSMNVGIYDIERKELRDVYETKAKDFDLAYIGSYIEWLDDKKVLFLNGNPAKPNEGVKIIDLKTNKIEGFENMQVSYWTEKGILAFVPSEKGTEIFLLDENGKTKEKFLQSDASLMPASRISNDKIILYGGKTREHYKRLYLLDLKSKQIDEFKILKDYILFSLEFSPDGNKFICVAIKYTEDAGGYYIYDIVSEKLTFLKALNKIDKEYVMSLYFGTKKKDYSWK